MKTYEFINPETNQIEKVKLERWGWAVIYNDGTELRQFDQEGKFHRLAEIDQSQVDLFIMYRTDNEKIRIDTVIPPGARIIHKYKNVRPFYHNDFVRVYEFGYRTGKKPNYQYHFNFILPDDRLIQSPVEDIDLVTFDLTRK